MENISPQQPESQQQLESLNADHFLQSHRIHEALNPRIVIDKAMQEGYSGDERELHDQANKLQKQVITEVIMPETVAHMSERALRHTGEEVYDSLIRTRMFLHQTEEGSKPIHYGLRELEDAMPRAQYALRNLQELASSRGQMDTDMVQRSVYDLRNFSESYEQATRRMSNGLIEQQDYLRSARVSADQGAETAEEGRRHFLAGRNQAENNPENAYFDGVEDQVESRGAATVAEHQHSVNGTIENNVGYIADLRDDCSNLSTMLTNISARLEVAKAIETMPRAGNVSELIYQLNSLSYRAMESGQLPAGQTEQLLDEISRMLNTAKSGAESIQAGNRRDSEALESAQANINSILNSEAMAKAL